MVSITCWRRAALSLAGCSRSASRSSLSDCGVFTSGRNDSRSRRAITSCQPWRTSRQELSVSRQ